MIVPIEEFRAACIKKVTDLLPDLTSLDLRVDDTDAGCIMHNTYVILSCHRERLAGYTFDSPTNYFPYNDPDCFKKAAAWLKSGAWWKNAP